MATNARRLNHSECAGEYIEAISVITGLCSASLGCLAMGDLHSERLIPKRIRIVSDLWHRLCLLIWSLGYAGWWRRCVPCFQQSY